MVLEFVRELESRAGDVDLKDPAKKCLNFPVGVRRANAGRCERAQRRQVLWGQDEEHLVDARKDQSEAWKTRGVEGGLREDGWEPLGWKCLY